MKKKPNIVFVLTDDQGAWAMGCAGNQDVNNAYYVQSAFEMINKKEADANKTVLYLDFNYVRGIDQTTNKPIWASTTVMYYVMATED